MKNNYLKKCTGFLSLCAVIMVSFVLSLFFGSFKKTIFAIAESSTQITENIAEAEGATITGNTIDGMEGTSYQGEIPYVIVGDSDLDFTFSMLMNEYKGNDFALNFTYTVCSIEGTPIFDIVYKGDGQMSTQVYVKYGEYIRSHTYNIAADTALNETGWYYYNKIPAYCGGWAAPSLFGTSNKDSLDTGALSIRFNGENIQVWTSYYIAQNWTSPYSLRSTGDVLECLIAEFDGTDVGFDQTSRMEKGMSDGNGWGLPQIYNQLKDGYRIKFNTTNVGSDSTNYDIDVTFNSLTATKLLELYTIAFNPNNGIDTETLYYIQEGGILDISQVPQPEKQGCIFAGWYNGEEKFDSANPITSDMQITAKWLTMADLGSAYTQEAFCDGASIRLAEDGKSGIRFHVRVPADSYLGNNINSVQTGVLVIPTDKLGGVELTHATTRDLYTPLGAKAADEGTSGNWCETVDDGVSYMEALVYVYNIPEDSFDRGFTFRGYLKDNENYYYTSDTDGRSIHYVAMHANHAYNTQGVNGTIQYTDVQLGILENYTPAMRTATSSNLKNLDKFNANNCYYRVGNANAVAFDKLFATNEVNTDIAPVNLSVTFETLQGNATGMYADGNFQFSNTGFVKISVLDTYSRKSSILIVEVVNGTNVTSSEITTSTVSTNVVLLNDVKIASGGYVIYSNCTVYGNGFTFSVEGGVSKFSSGTCNWGIITLTANAKLDNLVIIGDTYTKFGTYTSDSYNVAAVYSQGGTIQNCYIQGCASPVLVEGATTIKSTTLYGGAVANLQLKNGATTLNDVTTVNYNDGRKVIGLGVAFRTDALATTTLTINGSFKQYNFVASTDADNSGASTLQQIYSLMFDSQCSGYHFSKDGKTYANTGIVSMSENITTPTITDNTSSGYQGKSVSKTVWFTTVKGYVYTLPNTVGTVDNGYVKANDTHIASVQGGQSFQVGA